MMMVMVGGGDDDGDVIVKERFLQSSSLDEGPLDVVDSANRGICELVECSGREVEGFADATTATISEGDLDGVSLV